MTKELMSGLISSGLVQTPSSKATGQILSLFDHSFNIAFEEELLNVASSRLDCSSFGLTLPETDFEDLRISVLIGDRVKRDANRLMIYSSLGGVFEIVLSKEKLIDLKIAPVQADATLIATIIKTLAEFPIREKAGLHIDPHTQNFLDTLTVPFLPQSEFETSANFLIGRGRGLTPSGDDILLGYLMTFKLFDLPIHSELLQSNTLVTKTTIVSANYLRMLDLDIISESFKRFNKAILYRNIQHLRLSISRITEIGATSGFDTLLGVKLALKRILAEIPENGKTIDSTL
jgi:hypothetical protein